VGDTVLQQVSSLIDTGIRRSDGVGRWGGEEFVVMAYNSPLDSAMVLAEKLRRRVEECKNLHAQVTISIGVAQIGPAESFEAVLHRADIALYQAKNAGRNRVKSHP
jgi:diguanylate cyclase (GGDEF)-like protein